MPLDPALLRSPDPAISSLLERSEASRGGHHSFAARLASFRIADAHWRASVAALETTRAALRAAKASRSATQVRELKSAEQRLAAEERSCRCQRDRLCRTFGNLVESPSVEDSAVAEEASALVEADSVFMDGVSVLDGQRTAMRLMELVARVWADAVLIQVPSLVLRDRVFSGLQEDAEVEVVSERLRLIESPVQAFLGSLCGEVMEIRRPRVDAVFGSCFSRTKEREILHPIVPAGIRQSSRMDLVAMCQETQVNDQFKAMKRNVLELLSFLSLPHGESIVERETHPSKLPMIFSQEFQFVLKNSGVLLAKVGNAKDYISRELKIRVARTECDPAKSKLNYAHVVIAFLSPLSTLKKFI